METNNKTAIAYLVQLLDQVIGLVDAADNVSVTLEFTKPAYYILPEVLTGTETTDIKIPYSWINNKFDNPAYDDIKGKLEETAANGLPVWQNFLLGIADTAMLQVSFAKAEGSTADAPKTKVCFAVETQAPTGTGATVTYTLMKSEDVGTSWTEAGTSTAPSFTVALPAAAAKTLYYIKVSILPTAPAGDAK